MDLAPDCICVSLWKTFQHSTQESAVYIHDKILQSQVSAKRRTLRDRGHIKEVNKEPDTLEIYLHWVENVKQQRGINWPWRQRTLKWWNNNLQTVRSSSLSKLFLSREIEKKTEWALEGMRPQRQATSETNAAPADIACFSIISQVRTTEWFAVTGHRRTNYKSWDI